MRRGSTLLLVVVAVVAASACGQRVTVADEVFAALAATEGSAHRFVYEEQTAGRDLVIEGAIEDDFRREATIRLGGTAVYREVVMDDTLAVQIPDPRGLALLADEPPVPGSTDTDPDEPAADPATALATRDLLLRGGWVEDLIGAPSFLSASRTERGRDPIADAMNVFADVRAAVRAAPELLVLDVDDPRYRPDEDPFPLPAEGTVRVDVLRPGLPGALAVGSDGVRVPPDAAHFRRMSIYVTDGRVTAVRETIDVASRVDDVADAYDLDLAALDSTDERVAAVLGAINQRRSTAGQPAITPVTRSLIVADAGSDVRVGGPDAADVASLLLLRNRGSATGAPPTAPSDVS